MARKRAERQAAVNPPKSAPVQKPTVTPGKVVLYALCPVCGRAVPERRGTVRGSKGVNIETEPYFDTIQWEPDKPFGIARPATGKGSFSQSSYIDREDAPELFEAVKRRFLNALREWLHKGWIQPEDLKNLKQGR
jgi:hypothetical protein